MEWGYEGFIDKYGYPVFETPSEPIEGIDGGLVRSGVIEHWENEVEGLKHDADALNEYYSHKHVFKKYFCCLRSSYIFQKELTRWKIRVHRKCC